MYIRCECDYSVWTYGSSVQCYCGIVRHYNCIETYVSTVSSACVGLICVIACSCSHVNHHIIANIHVRNCNGIVTMTVMSAHDFRVYSILCVVCSLYHTYHACHIVCTKFSNFWFSMCYIFHFLRKFYQCHQQTHHAKTCSYMCTSCRDEGEVFIDAFNRGRQLSQEECLNLLSATPRLGMFEAAPPHKVRQLHCNTTIACRSMNDTTKQ